MSRVVIPGGVDDLDVRFGQPAELGQQESLALEGPAASVKEVAGDQHRVHLLADSGVHAPGKGLACSMPQAIPHVVRPTGEGGVEVDIRDVDETQRATRGYG